MPRKKTFIDNQYHGTKLCDTPREFSYDYIRAIDGVITTMTERHSKVLVVRFDLRYPKDHNADNSNRDFSGTLQGVCREFSRKGYDPQYVARREQVTSENQHYHVGILLDGNKKRSPEAVRQTVEMHWAKHLDIPLEEVQQKVLVYPCNKAPDGSPRENGRMIIRGTWDNHKQKQDTMRQLSYLAKVDENDQTPSSTKKFFTSQFAKDYSVNMQKREYWKEQYRKKKEREGKAYPRYPGY